MKLLFGILAAIVAVVTAVTWPLAKIFGLMALGFIGIGVATLEMYDQTTGEVLHVTASDPNGVLPRNLRVAYEYDGRSYQGFRRISSLTSADMKVGDRIPLWVCREDPDLFKTSPTDTSDCPFPGEDKREALAP